MQVVALIWDYFLTQTVVSLTKSSWFCLFLDASCSLIILWLELHLCCLPMQQSFACLLLAFAFLRSRGNPAPSKNSFYSYDFRSSLTIAVMLHLMGTEGEFDIYLKISSSIFPSQSVSHWSSFRFYILMTRAEHIIKKNAMLKTQELQLYDNGSLNFLSHGNNKDSKSSFQILQVDTRKDVCLFLPNEKHKMRWL